MSTNVLDLQRLPAMNTLGFAADEDVAETCTVCSVTCSVTAIEN